MVSITASKVLSVNAKRNFGQINGMSLNINFDSVKFEGGKLFVTYSYTVNYDKDIASLTVTGELTLEDSGMKKLEDEYKKTKVLPQQVTEDVVTACTFTSTAAGTLLAYALNLPAPINVPRAKLSHASSKQAS
ncbi:Uncharacterised protein [uncultured archaeon]|nr:Uncharacterised protein [uncultured archaeon]